MNKIILIVAAGLLLFSCIKDRTCDCTRINTKTGDTLVSKTKIIGSTKSQAKAQCVSTSETNSSGATITKDCKLN